MAQQNALTYILPVLIVLPLLYRRLRKLLQPQELKLRRLWIRPAIYLVLAAVAIVAPTPGAPALTSSTLAELVLAGVIGAALGWQWGRSTALHIHPETGTLMQTGSLAGMIVFLALVLLKLGLRFGLNAGAPSLHLNAVLIADISICFSAMLFAVRGLEIYLRAQRIMGERTGTT
jgi:Protein of unknown function (DUF1453)